MAEKIRKNSEKSEKNPWDPGPHGTPWASDEISAETGSVEV